MSRFRLQAPLRAPAIAAALTAAGNVASATGITNVFDALYPSGLTLPALSTSPSQTMMTRPANKATGVGAGNVQHTGAYGEKYFKVTDINTDGNNNPETVMRHDYSRRWWANADETLTLALDGNGFWRLYHGPRATAGTPFVAITASGTSGYLSGLAGNDAEAEWDVTDPLKLHYWGGGLIRYTKTFSSLGATTVSESNATRANFTGRLPWAAAEQVWTKAEGMSSADGRYYCFMATRYDTGSQTNIFYGIFTWDAQTDTILGTRAAADFAVNTYPDHCSMSATGTYAVPSWAYTPTNGTRRIARSLPDTGTMMYNESVHSDLCLGPAGEDVYVYIDNNGSDGNDGWIMMCNMATLTKTRLLYTYQSPGGACALHLSGKAFNKPGWVIASFYADYINYGTYPASPKQAWHNKVLAIELHSTPEILMIGSTQVVVSNYGGYFGEHQATVSRYGYWVVLSTNFNNDSSSTDLDPKVEDIVIALHSNSIPAARTT